MSIPRDHHFIPAFYLESWAGPDGKLIEHTKHGDRIRDKPVGPRGTGFLRDLYAFPELSGRDAQHLEMVFFDYADRTGSKALEIQLTNPTIKWPPELVTAWSRFIVGIQLRHPDSMPELRAGAAASWDASRDEFEERYQGLRKPTDPATMEEYIALKDPLAKTKIQLNMIIKALNNEFICKHINQMIWSVADLSKSRKELLVSDRPVEIHDLSNKNGLVTLPLTPTKLFFAVNEDAALQRIKNTPPAELIDQINLAVVSRASRFVWSHDDSHQDFIQKHMSTNMPKPPLFPHLKYPVAAVPEPYFKPASAPRA